MLQMKYSMDNCFESLISFGRSSFAHSWHTLNEKVSLIEVVKSIELPDIVGGRGSQEIGLSEIKFLFGWWVELQLMSWVAVPLSSLIFSSSRFFNSDREYPAVVSVARVGNLEVSGATLKGNSYWYCISRVVAVVSSLAKLLWIKRSIISLRQRSGRVTAQDSP